MAIIMTLPGHLRETFPTATAYEVLMHIIATYLWSHWGANQCNVCKVHCAVSETTIRVSLQFHFCIDTLLLKGVLGQTGKKKYSDRDRYLKIDI